MGDYVVVGYLQPANKQARQKVLCHLRSTSTQKADSLEYRADPTFVQILEKLMPISEYARTQEPEVSKYAITIPVDESEVTIYVIEE